MDWTWFTNNWIFFAGAGVIIAFIGFKKLTQWQADKRYMAEQAKAAELEKEALLKKQQEKLTLPSELRDIDVGPRLNHLYMENERLLQQIKGIEAEAKKEIAEVEELRKQVKTEYAELKAKNDMR